MSNQISSLFAQQLQELDELYHTVLLAEYESELKTVVKYLQQTLPDFTIAYAEIATIGSDRQVHGGMSHVIIPTERSVQ